MNIEEFDYMIANALKDVPISDIYDENFDSTPATISRKTDKYIKKLSKTMFCSPKPEKRRRRFAMRYVAVALIGASVLTVGTHAYRSKYSFTMGDAKMEEISIQPSADDKTSIEEVYELTYNLDGYKLTSYSERKSGVSTCYEKGTHLIDFSQCLISSDDRYVDTEDAIVQTIAINGEEAIYIDPTDEYGDTQMLIWTYDGYEFFLLADTEPGKREFSKEQVIEMAESIEIKD